MSRPTVVWVTQEASAAPRTGGALRSHRLVHALAEQADVDVVSLLPVDADAYCAATGARSVTVCSVPQQSRWTSKVIGWTHAWPAAFAQTLGPGRELVSQAVARGSLPVLEHLRTLPYRPRGAACVVALQNVDSDLIGQVAAGASPLRRVTSAVDQRLARLAESRLGADERVLVTVVSERDRERLGVPALVVANGTDLPLAVPELPVAGDVLFLASMRYQPNREAVAWWAQRVWPVAQDLPRLAVAGSGADTELADLAGHEALTIVGEVEQIGPTMASAAVFVIPLREGGGTRLKLLDALAWGRPVVATSKGAEGLPVVHGEHLLIADRPEEFAAAVHRLLTDRALAARLATAGRRLVEGYAWSTITPAFVEAVLDHAARFCSATSNRA